MVRLNVRNRTAAPHGRTHEGAPAAATTVEQDLTRSVMSCMLWENEFYEDGEEISKRITRLASQLPVEKLARIAITARHQANLRHVPLVLLSILAKIGRGNGIVANTIAAVLHRGDEPAEFLTVHAKLNGVEPNAVKKKISAQMKKGIARAFNKFDEYQLAKYNRPGPIRMIDVLRLCHSAPEDGEIAEMRSRLLRNELDAPDTWESNLVAGKDKKQTFERLLREGKLGYMALLRNLRLMTENSVDERLVRDAIVARKGSRYVLPFRYIAAARAVPRLEPYIDQALLATVEQSEPLQGMTAILVDVSGSMNDKLSAKSDLTRRDAAAALASIIKGDRRVFAFSDQVTELPPRLGMAGVEAIQRVPQGGTELFAAIQWVNQLVKYDRIIVITDEQAFFDHRINTCPAPKGKGYMINVASAKKGVGYGPWIHIDGFSEAVLRYIRVSEGYFVDNGPDDDE